jgi:hypothetical protein
MCKNISSPHNLLTPVSVIFQNISVLLLACSDSELVPKLWILRHFVESSEWVDLGVQSNAALAKTQIFT